MIAPCGLGCESLSGAFAASVAGADTEAEVLRMATAFVAGVSLQRAVSAHGPLPEGTLRTLVAIPADEKPRG